MPGAPEFASASHKQIGHQAGSPLILQQERAIKYLRGNRVPDSTRFGKDSISGGQLPGPRKLSIGSPGDGTVEQDLILATSSRPSDRAFNQYAQGPVYVSNNAMASIET